MPNVGRTSVQPRLDGRKPHFRVHVIARGAWRTLRGAVLLGGPGGGTPVVLASGPGPALSAGDTIRTEVQGTSIRGLINGAVMLTASDSNLTGGAAGVTFLAATGTSAAYFESWSGGSLP